ncbi:MAG: hypothetical protein AB2A00_03640 [Myxococcota bacterium]
MGRTPRVGQGPSVSAASLQQADAARRTQGTSEPNQTLHEVEDFKWLSQFDKRVPGAGNKACFRAASMSAAKSGAKVDGDERFQVALGENKAGKISKVDKKAAREGVDYIDSQLASGKPVVVGITDKDKAYNLDGITDHFVTITAKKTDEKGRTYYEFRDPGTSHEARSTGRFYVGDDGVLRGKGPYQAKPVNYEVAMIRKNVP